MIKQVKIVVHNARFHSDDVFGVAALLLLLEKRGVTGSDVKVVRTRKLEEISEGDYVLDVGGIYDAEANKFDHHQADGAGKRPNGIPFASFGLIWKKFGAELCGNAAVAEILDRSLVQPIDAMDNGVDLYKPLKEDVYPYLIQDLVFSFGPTWKESDQHTDQSFMKAVDIAGAVLDREIKRTGDELEGEEKFEEVYKNSEDKKIAVLEKYYPYENAATKYPELLFVVRPNIQDKTWKVEAVKGDIHSYKNRKNFPEGWAGKRDGELAEITGVADAFFCHNGRFLAVTRSKEGAVKLAELAVKEK